MTEDDSEAGTEVSDELNKARIQDNEPENFSQCSSRTWSVQSKKTLSSQTESIDFRKELSEMIKSLEQEQMQTPVKDRIACKKMPDLTKTLTIKGKKGRLYQDICPVCLAEYADEQGCLGCKHKFCFDCISEWTNTSTACPCCRKTYYEIKKQLKGQAIETIKVEPKQMVFREQDYFICYVCGRGDNENVLLICDMCDFYCCHIYCDTALNSTIPEGDWFCRHCVPLLGSYDFINTSGLSSGTTDHTSEEEKPVAARTRSRNTGGRGTNIYQRLRRNRV